MSSTLSRMMRSIGLGANEVELYNRGFEKASLRAFGEAAENFSDAASMYIQKRDLEWGQRARANSYLYRYLGSKDPRYINPLLKELSGLQTLEKIGLQAETMPVEGLRLELECRRIEADITQTVEDDILRLRDQHKYASEKFQALDGFALITYEYNGARDGHNEKAIERCAYHLGLYHYYEALLKRDSNPLAAAENLAMAGQAFSNCNDQKSLERVTQLLENWCIKRICWVCGREMQGKELNFSMSPAEVTLYTQRLIQSGKEDISMVDLKRGTIAVCVPCGSMITSRAQVEADKVRRELSIQLASAFSEIQALRRQVSQLEENLNIYRRGS